MTGKFRLTFSLTAFAALPSITPACPTCRPEVMSRVYTGEFAQTLSVLLLPIALVIVGAIFATGPEALVARRSH